MSDAESAINPQVQRTQKLMLDAARGLLSEHGPGAVTHLRVAEAAGVARATVYRHWPDRAAILLELLKTSSDLNLVPPPPSIPITDRVAGTLRMFAATLNGGGGQTLAAMIGLAEWDVDVFAALQQMTVLGPRYLRNILTAACDDGSLIEEADAELLTDRLIGPLYFRRLLYHDEITDAYIDELVRTTIEPLVDRKARATSG